MGTGHSTACEIVNSVCKAITSHLLSRYISITTDEVQVQESVAEFAGKKGFPQAIGEIDGCHLSVVLCSVTKNRFHHLDSQLRLSQTL